MNIRIKTEMLCAMRYISLHKFRAVQSLYVYDGTVMKIMWVISEFLQCILVFQVNGCTESHLVFVCLSHGLHRSRQVFPSVDRNSRFFGSSVIKMCCSLKNWWNFCDGYKIMDVCTAKCSIGEPYQLTYENNLTGTRDYSLKNEFLLCLIPHLFLFLQLFWPCKK